MNPTGSGRFVPSSTGGSPFSSVRFFPFNGNTITIAGVQYVIPSPGIEGNFFDATIDGVLHQTLAPNSLYYVYAYMDAGVMKLEFSLWGWVTDLELPYSGWKSGVGIKIYDNTRSIVGMVHTNGISKALGDDKNQCTSSFYNRVRIGLKCVLDSNAWLAGTTWPIGWTEPSSTNRVSCVVWQDDLPEATLSGSMTNNTLYGHNEVGISIDGADPGSSIAVWDSLSANCTMPFACKASSDGGMSEGYHYFGLKMKVTPGSIGYLRAGSSTVWGQTQLVLGPVPS